MADGILTPCNVARSWHWFRQVTAFCNVACGFGIVTVNSPSGSILQCDTWLWDDMPLNSPKRPPYWNYTSGFDFDHITAVDMSFCTVSDILSKSDHLRQKNDVMSIFKMADLSHLGFYGSNNGFFEKPNYIASYRSSVETIALNCLVFDKNCVSAFWRQDPRWRISAILDFRGPIMVF